jgi:hypothetical protein
MTHPSSTEQPSNSNPYTPQYKTITQVGHTRPTQEIGAPALIWHVAVWPASKQDPQDVRPSSEDIDIGELGDKRPELSELPYQEAIKQHNSKRSALLIGGEGGEGQPLTALNHLLRRLQERGRTIAPVERRPEAIEQFKLVPMRRAKGGNASFEFADPESRGFTLWWRDADQRALKKPGYDPLRVRVQVETQIDYFSITFLIDVGNPWSAGQVFSSAEAPGERRKKIFRYIEDVREKCERDLRPENDTVEKPLVPLDRVPPPRDPIPLGKELDDAIDKLADEVKKQSVPEHETVVLLKASKYLYAGVWEEFCKDFGFRFEDIAGPRGRVFANFRGLVMSTPGASGQRVGETTYDAAQHKATATPGAKRFLKFDEDGSEPNAVVKAYWPFIRRIKPYADYREYIACGVLKWRALYITALGAQSEYNSGDESMGRYYEVPSKNLPEHDDKHGKTWLRKGREPLPEDSLLGPKGEEPVRYLLLTKFEPHRRQLGRIVDRINALGTMRLFALKGWAQLREASEHVRMRGQELDNILANWIKARHEIERRFGDDADERNRKLSHLNEYIELQLIGIAKGLDEMGQGAVGGLPYRIARSSYYAQLFKDMRKTLGVGNIESWTSYDQFADRGLQPIFEFVKSVGRRLRLLRQRLANVMQSIQTSALVTQSEETRKNTRRLELLYISANSLGAVGVLALMRILWEPVKNVSSLIWGYCDQQDLPQAIAPWCQLHRQLIGTTEVGVFAVYVAAAMMLALLSVVVLAVYIAVRDRGAQWSPGKVMRASFVALLVTALVASMNWWLPTTSAVLSEPIIGLLRLIGTAFSPIAVACAVAFLVSIFIWFIAYLAKSVAARADRHDRNAGRASPAKP